MTSDTPWSLLSAAYFGRKRLLGAPDRLSAALTGDLLLGTEVDAPHRDVIVPLSAFDTHAQLIGPTGTGKTCCEGVIGGRIMDLKQSALIGIDNHGTDSGLFARLKAHAYRNGHEARLVTLDVNDVLRTGWVTGISPLNFGSDLELQARTGVELLKRVSPENDEKFQAMLETYGFVAFLGLLASRLAVGDSMTALSPGENGRRWYALANALDEHFPEHAARWRRLAELLSKQSVSAITAEDSLVGSTLRRIQQAVENPRVRLSLSSLEHVIDIPELIRSRGILLVNLQPTHIHPSQKRYLATLLVSSICRFAMSQEGQMAPCHLLIDEVHECASSDLYTILCGGRKYGLRLIVGHQSLTQFLDETGDRRLFNALLGCARLKIVFPGAPDADLELLAKKLWLPWIDPDKRQLEIFVTRQLQEVQEVVSRRYGSSSNAITSSGSHSASSSPASGASDHGWNSAGDSSGSSYGYSQSSDETVSLGALPGEPFQELSSVTFDSIQNQLHRHAARMQGMPDQHCTLQMHPSLRPVHLRVADAPPPSPLFHLDVLRRWDLERFPQLSWASRIEQVTEEQRSRLRLFEGRPAGAAGGARHRAERRARRHGLFTEGEKETKEK